MDFSSIMKVSFQRTKRRGLLYALLQKSFSVCCDFKTFHSEINHLKTFHSEINHLKTFHSEINHLKTTLRKIRFLLVLLIFVLSHLLISSIHLNLLFRINLKIMFLLSYCSRRYFILNCKSRFRIPSNFHRTSKKKSRISILLTLSFFHHKNWWLQTWNNGESINRAWQTCYQQSRCHIIWCPSIASCLCNTHL